MSKFFFNILLWIVGVVGGEESTNKEFSDIQARGKCRQIIVENNTVILSGVFLLNFCLKLFRILE